MPPAVGEVCIGVVDEDVPLGVVAGDEDVLLAVEDEEEVVVVDVAGLAVLDVTEIFRERGSWAFIFPASSIST